MLYAALSLVFAIAWATKKGFGQIYRFDNRFDFIRHRDLHIIYLRDTIRWIFFSQSRDHPN